MAVVMTLPSSTMNITGFFSCSRGSSFGNESRIACEHELVGEDARRGGLRGREAALLASQIVEGEVELEDVHARLAEEVEERPSVCCRISCSTVASGRWRTAATRGAWSFA